MRTRLCAVALAILGGASAATAAPGIAPSVTREARATWSVRRVLPSGTVETTTYAFDVSQGAGVTDPPSYEQGGEATATSQACTTTCAAAKTLTGPASIAPLGAVTGENLFLADPAMRQASFTGTLADDHGGSCRFSVMWFAEASGPIVTPPPAGPSAQQPAQVTLSSACWGVLSQGDGSITTAAAPNSEVPAPPAR